MKTPSKDSIPESEEERFKQKCKELKKRVLEVEESNEIATIALSRTQASIRRLRLEYSILLERLEDRANQIPDGIVSFEEMACPPTPTILDDSLIKAKNGSKKGKSKSKAGAGGSGSGGAGTGSGTPSDVASTTMGKQKARDPDLPKRPTNAYLIFCELEKERIRQGDPNASDLSRSMTEAWKGLSEEERRPYFKLYEDDRLRYQREMAEYHHKKENTEPELKKQKVEASAAEGATTTADESGTTPVPASPVAAVAEPEDEPEDEPEVEPEAEAEPEAAANETATTTAAAEPEEAQLKEEPTQ